MDAVLQVNTKNIKKRFSFFLFFLYFYLFFLCFIVKEHIFVYLYLVLFQYPFLIWYIFILVHFLLRLAVYGLYTIPGTLLSPGEYPVLSERESSQERKVFYRFVPVQVLK